MSSINRLVFKYLYFYETEFKKIVYQEQEKSRWDTTFPALISHQDTLYRKTLTELNKVAQSLRDITISYGTETSKNAHNFFQDSDDDETEVR